MYLYIYTYQIIPAISETTGVHDVLMHPRYTYNILQPYLSYLGWSLQWQTGFPAIGCWSTKTAIFGYFVLIIDTNPYGINNWAFLYPIGSMYAIYGKIYHQYTPFMLAYIAAPWIRHGYVMSSLKASWNIRGTSTTEVGTAQVHEPWRDAAWALRFQHADTQSEPTPEHAQGGWELGVGQWVEIPSGYVKIAIENGHI